MIKLRIALSRTGAYYLAAKGRHKEFNALTAVGALITLIDFTLSYARRFYSSMGNPLAVEGLKAPHIWGIQTPEANDETTQIGIVRLRLVGIVICCENCLFNKRN